MQSGASIKAEAFIENSGKWECRTLFEFLGIKNKLINLATRLLKGGQGYPAQSPNMLIFENLMKYFNSGKSGIKCLRRWA